MFINGKSHQKYLKIIRGGLLFFEGGGDRAISQKNMTPATVEKSAKNAERGAMAKQNRASAFYYAGPVFDFLNSCTSYCPPRNTSCTTLR